MLLVIMAGQDVHKPRRKSSLVRVVGIEPTLQWNGILNPARLPIPPHPHRRFLTYKAVYFRWLELISTLAYFFVLNASFLKRVHGLYIHTQAYKRRVTSD